MQIRHANVILKWTRTKWFGKLKDRKGEYVGEFDESGKRCGKGINIEPDGYKYDGTYLMRKNEELINRKKKTKKIVRELDG